MSQTGIEVYRIKVLVAITYLSYLLIENSNHALTCDIWIIGLLRVLHRLPWIFPVFSKEDTMKYQVCSIPISLLLHATLLIRRTYDKYSYCETSGNLESAIYFETYFALILYIAFMIAACVSQITFVPPIYKKIKLESIPFVSITKWNQTDRMCCICYDDFIMIDKLAVIQCGHYDHVDCMNEWIEKSQSCPRCKHKVI